MYTPIEFSIFSTAHVDFNPASTTSYTGPEYVPSPYGAWLADSPNPSMDTFSNWYRKVDGENYEYNKIMILKGRANPYPHHM